MGDKGGGSPDLSGIEEATRQATALQKKTYQDILGFSQPYMGLGEGAVGKLSDLLGISGGSVMGREDIYNELLPQYTQTQTFGGGATPTVSRGGNVYDLTQYNPQAEGGELAALRELYYKDKDWQDAAKRGGFNIIGGATTTKDITDYDALNAAVEERLAGQETPEGYGSLLERFDMTKFEEDPGAQFRREQAQQALERSMAAQGVTLGGGGYGTINPQVAQALNEQQQGLASQEYGNAYNRYVQDQLNTYNMLTGAAGIGQGTLGTVAGAGQNMATNVGQLGTGLASAQLNAQLAQQSQPSGFGSILGAGATLLGAPSSSVFGSLFQ